MKKTISGWIFVLLLVYPTLAFQGESTNYKMEISNIGYEASQGSSVNYQADYSMVDQAVNDAEGTNYNSQLGFYHKIKSGFEGIIELLKNARQVYPVAMLVIMMFIGGVYTRNRRQDVQKETTTYAS